MFKNKLRISILLGCIFVVTIVTLGLTQHMNSEPTEKVYMGSSYILSYDSLSKLTSGADAIVLGTVQDVVKKGTLGGGKPFPYTDFSFSIEKVIKGDIKENTLITIHQLGGQLNGKIYEKYNDPLFKPGEKTLLFLGYRSKYFVLNGSQGRYPVIKGKIASMNHINPRIKLVGVDLSPVSPEVFIEQIRMNLPE